MHNWIRCSDHLPPKAVSVLGAIAQPNEEPYVDVCCHLGQGWVHGLIDQNNVIHDVAVNVTHWMHLPAPPLLDTEPVELALCVQCNGLGFLGNTPCHRCNGRGAVGKADNGAIAND